MGNVAPVEVAAGYALKKIGGAGWLGSVHMTGKQSQVALAATSAAIVFMPRVIHNTPDRPTGPSRLFTQDVSFNNPSSRTEGNRSCRFNPDGGERGQLRFQKEPVTMERDQYRQCAPERAGNVVHEFSTDADAVFVLRSVRSCREGEGRG
jgi:hypothetical protein